MYVFFLLLETKGCVLRKSKPSTIDYLSMPVLTKGV